MRWEIPEYWGRLREPGMAEVSLSATVEKIQGPSESYYI